MDTIKLTTPVAIPNVSPSLSLSLSRSKILTMGSCFSDAIGSRLQGMGFDTLVNPFGTLYNPLSMATALALLVAPNETPFDPSYIIESSGRFYSMMHHSRYSASSVQELIAELERSLATCRHYVREATHLLLTFGSAFVYRYRQNGHVVANCHKLPQEKFDLRMTSINEMTETLETTIKRLLEINPKLTFLLTVSPIRYVGYGLHRSQLSKARLLLVAEQLVESFPQAIHYFPAYEIMLDELRDYRFYGDDLVHPSTLAEELIFAKFIASWGAKDEQEKVRWMTKLQKMLLHKSQNAEQEQLHKEQIARWIKKHRDKLPEDYIINRVFN